MTNQEKINAAERRISELKKLIKEWKKNENIN